MTKKQLKLSDQVIGQIRELLQLSILTQTNFVDHMRAVELEVSEKTEGSLILSEGYVTGWNEMSELFHKQAAEKAQELASTLATDKGEASELPEEVLISRDQTTGKLFATRPKKNQLMQTLKEELETRYAAHIHRGGIFSFSKTFSLDLIKEIQDMGSAFTNTFQYSVAPIPGTSRFTVCITLKEVR